MSERDETVIAVNEWRVTGEPGNGWPSYSHTWRSDRMYDDSSRAEGALTLTAEQAARRFAESVGPWDEGPAVSRRTVITTRWEDA